MATLVLFQAKSASYGYELWVTNGTTAGTSLVKTIYSGGNALPQNLTYLGNSSHKVVFSATDGASQSHGFELWVTNGTSAGTYLVADLNPGPSSSNPAGF